MSQCHRHLLELDPPSQAEDNECPASWVLNFLLDKMNREPFSFLSCLGADSALAGVRVTMGKTGPIHEGVFVLIERGGPALNVGASFPGLGSQTAQKAQGALRPSLLVALLPDCDAL